MSKLFRERGREVFLAGTVTFYLSNQISLFVEKVCPSLLNLSVPLGTGREREKVQNWVFLVPDPSIHIRMHLYTIAFLSQ